MRVVVSAYGCGICPSVSDQVSLRVCMAVASVTCVCEWLQFVTVHICKYCCFLGCASLCGCVSPVTKSKFGFKTSPPPTLSPDMASRTPQLCLLTPQMVNPWPSPDVWAYLWRPKCVSLSVSTSRVPSWVDGQANESNECLAPRRACATASTSNQGP